MSLRSCSRPLFVALAMPVLSVALVAGCSSSSNAKAATNGSTASGVTTTAASGSSVASGSSGTGSASKLAKTCPTAAAASAAAGKTMPTPAMTSQGGALTCIYTDASTGVNVVLAILPGDASSASTFKTVVDAEASAQNAKVKPVSDIGDAAYAFTIPNNDASKGTADSRLEVLAGSSTVSVTGSLSPAGNLALAHLVVT